MCVCGGGGGNLPSSPILHAVISTICIQENSFSPDLSDAPGQVCMQVVLQWHQPRHKEQEVSQHELLLS